MAAGLGFKDFTTGEVLTAADVDGYLMQGVWVFASAAARDAAVTSPQEGNFAYLKDTNVTTYYTGSAWANLDTTGMTNPMTTTGDTIYSSSGSTPARLGIGSTGQVLTVAGGVPTWAAAAGGAGNLALITSGTLSGSSLTVSSLDTYTDLNIFLENPSWNTADDDLIIRINGSSSSNYRVNGYYHEGTSAYARINLQLNSAIFLTRSNVARRGGFGINFYAELRNCKNPGFTNFTTQDIYIIPSASVVTADLTQGIFEESSTVSSITIQTLNGYTFAGGTYRIYGA